MELGAKVVCGGKRHRLGGSFFELTVLRDVTNEMPISQEETFGPVAPLLRFEGSGRCETHSPTHSHTTPKCVSTQQ